MTATLPPQTFATRTPATLAPVTRPAVPAAGLAVGAMLSVQLGSALSIHLFSAVGAAGTAWLRFCAAAVVLLVAVRPRPWALPRAALRGAGALGLVMAVMTLAYFQAIERIPLGTAVALEFLGPLGVAVLRRGGSRTAMLWPALALVGVLALTQPWAGRADPVGVGFALAAGCAWGCYILLSQRVGDALPGLTGLALGMPVAALAATVVGAPQALGDVTPGVLLQVAALALLCPVLPYALEMQALRRLTTAAFGTLMALEPALAVLVGLVVLGQVPHAAQALGVVLVVGAGLGAERSGAR